MRSRLIFEIFGNERAKCSNELSKFPYFYGKRQLYEKLRAELKIGHLEQDSRGHKLSVHIYITHTDSVFRPRQRLLHKFVCSRRNATGHVTYHQVVFLSTGNPSSHHSALWGMLKGLLLVSRIFPGGF